MWAWTTFIYSFLVGSFSLFQRSLVGFGSHWLLWWGWWWAWSWRGGRRRSRLFINWASGWIVWAVGHIVWWRCHRWLPDTRVCRSSGAWLISGWSVWWIWCGWWSIWWHWWLRCSWHHWHHWHWHTETRFLDQLCNNEAENDGDGQFRQNQSFDGFQANESDKDWHQSFHFQLHEKQNGKEKLLLEQTASC